MTPMITVRSSGRCIERMELARTPSLPCRRRHRRLCPRRLLARLAWLGLAWLGLATYFFRRSVRFLYGNPDAKHPLCGAILCRRSALLCFLCLSGRKRINVHALCRTRRQHGISIRVSQGSAKLVLFFLICCFYCFSGACVRRTAFAPLSFFFTSVPQEALVRVFLRTPGIKHRRALFEFPL